jgi:glycosyltransferase involved in cell wall biosynthesis
MGVGLRAGPRSTGRAATIRITWYSNAPWAKSGYGIQTKQAIRRLKAAGHEVAVAANFGLHGTQFEWEGIPIFPGGKDKYSNDVAPGHAKLWSGQSGWVITLYDVWGLEPSYWDGLRVASWVPIDHQPVPPAVLQWCEKHLSLAWSQFGLRELERAGVQGLYVPLAIESSEYHPTDTLIRGDSPREVLGLPEDAFLVVINSANNGNYPPRKGWGEMFLAFATFAERHPDAYIYVHTDRYGNRGIDLPILATACGIPADRLVWADQYAYLNGLIEEADLAAIYTAADVYLGTSYAEGFGVPIIEAQACGTPVIVSDWTAPPELVGAGWVVPVQPMWDAPHAAFLGMPSIGGIVAALDQAYAAKGDASVSDKAIAKAAEYDADLVFETYWLPALAEMERLL